MKRHFGETFELKLLRQSTVYLVIHLQISSSATTQKTALPALSFVNCGQTLPVSHSLSGLVERDYCTLHTCCHNMSLNTFWLKDTAWLKACVQFQKKMSTKPNTGKLTDIINSCFLKKMHSYVFISCLIEMHWHELSEGKGSLPSPSECWAQITCLIAEIYFESDRPGELTALFLC